MQPYIPKTLVCIALAMLSFIVFADVRHHSYVLYDDIIIVNSPHFTSDLSLQNIISTAFNPPPRHIPYQMPLPLIAYMSLWHLFGENLGIHHVFSVFLHTITAILLFIFFARTTRRVGESAVVAALFTVHPLNVEPVCWYSGLNGIMAGFFFVLSLLTYSYYTRLPSVKRYVLILLFFGLSLLCKPTIIILPLLLLFLDLWPLERTALSLHAAGPNIQPPADSPLPHCRQKLKWLIIEKIPMIVLAGALSLVPTIMAARPSAHNGFDLTIVQPGAFLYYLERLWKTIYPVELTIYNPHPGDISPTAIAGAGLIFAGIIMTGLVIHRRHNDRKLLLSVLVGWLWYFTCLAPAVGIFTCSGRSIGDRHTYMALIGLFLMGTWIFSAITRYLKTPSSIRFLLVLLIIGAFAIISSRQVNQWKDSTTLFTHETRLHPKNPKAHTNLGDAFMEKNDIRKAIHYFKKAQELAPDKAITNTKMGTALYHLGEFDAAIGYYRKALAIEPDYTVAHNNLGNLFLERGETTKAIEQYKKAIATRPLSYKLHNNLATAFIQNGRVQEAIFHLNKAIAINPDYKVAKKNLENLMSRIQKGELSPSER
ncbi:MAG: tetratricopeptide repeat protein [Thermodesulfobacteriota bacterium]|nr:tetratricopeptide repeat protein [Thermodesulfobacteriota bacterium]